MHGFVDADRQRVPVAGIAAQKPGRYELPQHQHGSAIELGTSKHDVVASQVLRTITASKAKVVADFDPKIGQEGCHDFTDDVRGRENPFVPSLKFNDIILRIQERGVGDRQSGRAAVIENLKAPEIALVTVPNFSVSVNWPRWSDLYSIKRIALAWQELIAAGLPASLHPNGRTERDFERWREFIFARPEVQHLSYEFTTGPRRAGRSEFHLNQLMRLGRECGRPLHLLIYGGQDYWPAPASVFETVTGAGNIYFYENHASAAGLRSRKLGHSFFPCLDRKGRAA